MQPSSRKGALRAALEARLRDSGIRSIILRAGDFYGGDGHGAWFDRVITRYVDHGRLTYPGPLDVVHEWAYVPDLAAALVPLVEARAQFDTFETFGFPGHAVTGAEFVGAIVRALRRDLKVERMPWWLLRLLGPLVPTLSRTRRNVLFLGGAAPHRRPQTANDDRTVPHTPFETAIRTRSTNLGCCHGDDPHCAFACHQRRRPPSTPTASGARA